MPPERSKNLKVESRATGPPYATPRRRRFRGRHLLIAVLMAVAALGIYRLRRPGANLPLRGIFIRKTVLKPVEGRSTEHAPPPRPAASDPFEIRHLTLHSGDSLGKAAEGLNIAGANLKGLREACDSSPFDRIGDGDELLLVLNRADGQPVRLVYLRSGGGAYTFRKNSSGWECGSNENAAAGPGETAHGALSKSFYHSCAACGVPGPLISKLADIFSNEIDVTSDLKKGDSFSVFFEQYPIESSGRKRNLILGAEMDVSGKVYQAVGFDADGSWDYFDGGGASLERQFSKAPLNYRALLQGDAGAVLKIFRPRFEIMYVVPAGAEVCTIGDGVVSAVHSTGGRFSIEIRHSRGYTSWYGNLSACSRGLKRGVPVRRSMAIGSAGPYGSGKAYFYFRLYKSGRPVNFETAEFKPDRSVPEAMLAEFKKTRDVCLTALRNETMTENKRKTASGKK